MFTTTLGLIENATAAVRAHRTRRERRMAVRHLSELDDNILKDIGIARSEILSVVYGSPAERRRGS